MDTEKLKEQLADAMHAPEGVTKECHHLASGVNVINSGLRAARTAALRLKIAMLIGRAPDDYNPSEDVAKLVAMIRAFAEVADDFGRMVAHAHGLTAEQIKAEADRQQAVVERHIAAEDGDADALDRQPGQDKAASAAQDAINKAKGGETLH